ncbi:MAG: M20/M25/M40 family metallo-hydrolase [Opitutus sp.]|nr:M20/M25/M40 family metallo-hydrolase [Opitutus sp.]
MSSEDARAQQLVASPTFKAAVAAFDRDYDRFVRELIFLTEIPAPPFKEQLRAEAYAKLLREIGLEDVAIDPEGNVLGLWRGRPGGTAPLLAVAAHLDTVFPEGTDVRVKRSGTRLSAPGIGDDTSGLAFLLAAIRAMKAARVETPGDILFIGNVGEEGPGDMRGIRYLFGQGPWKGRIKRFITVDGSNNDLITNGGLGSKRYRVTFKGPGGHSWGAFGQVSPAFAMGNAMAKLGKVVVPRQPKVSYNVGVVSGGTSVNSIPFEVAMEVDLRSISPEELAKIDGQFLKIVAEAVTEENAARATTFGKITADVKLIGERPSGVTSPDTAELRQVIATMKVFDKVPVWNVGSTDANLPISLGIPAFAMARGSAGREGRSHSLDEWTEVEKTAVVKDFGLALAVLLSVAETP